DPVRPRIEEHPGSGYDHHGVAGRLHHRFRDHHRDGVPVAGHGLAFHPSGELRRRTGDGGVSVLHRVGIRGHQPYRRFALFRGRSAAARRAAGGRDLTVSPVEDLRKDHAELTALRRDLHAHPELGFEEHRTAEIVTRELAAAGIEHHSGIGKTGIVGVIRGERDQSGRAVGLRADMDALPMHEENDFAHVSRFKGRMHGCGDDGHPPTLLGAGRYLSRTRRFDGRVYLIFQPGEEGFAGGKAMVEEGLFERFPAGEIYALHNWPAFPPAQMGLRPGPMMAAADRIEIHIEGRGGHGAHPHMTVDPVLVAGHIITAAQSMVARNVSPLDTAVVSICAMHSGNLAAMSVVPREARLVGTVRTFRSATQDRIEQRLNDLVHSIASAFGATATLKYERVYPATI